MLNLTTSVVALFALFALFALLLTGCAEPPPTGGVSAELNWTKAWSRSVIADYYQDADGVYVADHDADGAADLVVCWETSSRVTVHFAGLPQHAHRRWAMLPVSAQAWRAEDVVSADLDADGKLDVVSFGGDSTQAVTAHFAHTPNLDTWQLRRIAASQGRWWLTGAVADVDADGLLDIVAGGVTGGGTPEVAWFRGSSTPRDGTSWSRHTIAPAQWVMDVVVRDIDGDGDHDLYVIDRHGDARGVAWHEQDAGGWTARQILDGVTAMNGDVADYDGDGDEDVLVVSESPTALWWLERIGTTEWQAHSLSIDAPYPGANPRAVRVVDVDGDTQRDLVVSWYQFGSGSGITWSEDTTTWFPVAPAGYGVKYDVVRALDVDMDDDLDIVTTDAAVGAVLLRNPR